MSQEPKASRPAPAGYFLAPDGGSGLLPWSHAVDRLTSARNYWLATVSADGIPHVMPVWGVWLEDRLLFTTSLASRKAKNIAANENAVVHLESGAQLVVLEGIVRETVDPADVTAYIEPYNPKYSWDFTPEQVASGGLYEFRPRKAFAWLGDEGEAFSGTATRWVFDS